MDILVVARSFPWPETNGSAIRVANVVRALATVGDVDFFGVVGPGRASAGIEPPPTEPLARVGWAVQPRANRSLARRAAWLVRGRLPVELAGFDHRRVRNAFREWVRPRYDVVWIHRADTFVAVGDLVAGTPCIVDLDDLEDLKHAARLAAGARRSVLAEVQGRVNVRRWRRLQSEVAAAVEQVAVCSELDRDRLGVPNASVVPNGYPEPAQPLGRDRVGVPPTLLMVGHFSYGPNLDAAKYLVAEVLPRLRSQLPAVELRMVGARDYRLEELAGPGVTMTGLVDDIGAELASAGAVVVPVRFGGGTRIKILEAFAHRIPVVSTTPGCEGLGVHHREHLLVADDPDAFAAACVELLTDSALRSRLVEAGQRLYRDRFRWEALRPDVAALVVDVATGSASVRASDPMPCQGGGRPARRTR